jgi:hypothetical protein
VLHGWVVSIAVADLNGDGRPDLLVADGQVAMLLNIGGSPTTTTLISNVNPAAPNQMVTYTATGVRIVLDPV